MPSRLLAVGQPIGLEDLHNYHLQKQNDARSAEQEDAAPIEEPVEAQTEDSTEHPNGDAEQQDDVAPVQDCSESVADSVAPFRCSRFLWFQELLACMGAVLDGSCS